MGTNKTQKIDQKPIKKTAIHVIHYGDSKHTFKIIQLWLSNWEVKVKGRLEQKLIL